MGIFRPDTKGVMIGPSRLSTFARVNAPKMNADASASSGPMNGTRSRAAVTAAPIAAMSRAPAGPRTSDERGRQAQVDGEVDEPGMRDRHVDGRERDTDFRRTHPPDEGQRHADLREAEVEETQIDGKVQSERVVDPAAAEPDNIRGRRDEVDATRRNGNSGGGGITEAKRSERARA